MHMYTYTRTQPYKLISAVYPQTFSHTPSHLHILLYSHAYRLTDSQVQKSPYILTVTHTDLHTHTHPHTPTLTQSIEVGTRPREVF